MLEARRADPACPACGTPGLEVFYEQRGVTIHSTHLLDSTEEAARYPTGDIELALCLSCGLITNLRYDERVLDYAGRHEESQAFSPHFQAFARDLARQWIDRYALAGKTVLEIGCGKGHFLELMIEAGMGRAIGVDPGSRPERITGAVGERIEWVQEFYAPAHGAFEPDAIVCRHTLEHIPAVATFLKTIRRSLRERPEVVVLFELPDVLRVLREVAFWDIYYEHCSYFTLGSLARAFRSSGFDILKLALVYSGQYLIIEARPRPAGKPPAPPRPEEDSPRELQQAATVFASQFAQRMTDWRQQLRQARAAGKRGVVWGAGAKGLSFLTALGSEAGIEVAVDVNPYLQGRYLAVAGQKVVAPDVLVEYRPDFVVVMNPVYVEEIRGTLARLGLSPSLLAA